jgi:hypothetical protein
MPTNPDDENSVDSPGRVAGDRMLDYAPVGSIRKTWKQVVCDWLPTIAIAIWTIAFFGLCARTLVLKVDRHSVFPVFTSAGENWLSGRELYVKGGAEEFRYSPLIAAFFVPFDLLPLKIGEFLWRSLNFFSFVGGLYYCCKAGLPRRMSRCGIAVIFLLILPLAIGSLNNAQSNPLVLGLMLVSAAACMQRRFAVAAAAIALATCFKLYPIALGLLFLLYFPWGLGWRLLVCLSAAAVLPFVMQRAVYVMDQYTLWVHYLSSEDRQRGPITDWYRDFRAVWRVYVMPMSERSYLIIELVAAAGIAGICLLGRWRKWPIEKLIYFAFAFACCWMTVLGPATESSTYILLAPVVAWTLLMSDSAGRRDRPWRIAYGTVFSLFLASQLALNIPGGKYFRDHLQPLPVAGALLLATLVADTFRSHRQPADPL